MFGIGLGHDGGEDFGGPGSFEDSGALVKGGVGGCDVVDQAQAGAVYPCVAVGYEFAADVGDSLGGIHFDLSAGPPARNQHWEAW